MPAAGGVARLPVRRSSLWQMCARHRARRCEAGRGQTVRASVPPEPAVRRSWAVEGEPEGRRAAGGGGRRAVGGWVHFCPETGGGDGLPQKGSAALIGLGGPLGPPPRASALFIGSLGEGMALQLPPCPRCAWYLRACLLPRPLDTSVFL